MVLPKRQIAFRFDDFDLASLETVKYRPIEDALVIQNLRTEARLYLAKPAQDAREARLEDYLVRYLLEKNEIDYDAYSDLLYKLCGQLVSHIRSYLATDTEVENVLLYHGRKGAHSLHLVGQFIDQLQQRGPFGSKLDALSGDFFLVSLKLLPPPQPGVQVSQLFRKPSF